MGTTLAGQLIRHGITRLRNRDPHPVVSKGRRKKAGNVYPWHFDELAGRRFISFCAECSTAQLACQRAIVAICGGQLIVGGRTVLIMVSLAS